MPNPTILESTIAFWEAELAHSKFLMSPSTQVFVEHTIKYLKQLREIKDSKIPSGNKDG